MKLGVLGGTFDPIHKGHLAAAKYARDSLDLDEVLFLPAGRPWLKDDQPVTDAVHRLRMVELAVASDPGFRVSDMEIKRPGPTYSADTLDALKGDLGNDVELCLIAGMDALEELDRWHEPERVLELSAVVAVPRPGSERLDRDVFDSIRQGASEKVAVLDSPLSDVNSTDIRRRAAQGLSIQDLVPESVATYIEEQRLYRDSNVQERGTA